MSTSNGIVSYNGTSLITSTTAKIDSSNRTTNTSQPCFMVYLNTSVNNVTGDNTLYPLVFDTTVFDQNSNITLNSSGKTIFTAPVTGNYQFSGTTNFQWTNGGGDESYLYSLVSSNGNIYRLNEASALLNITTFGCSFSIVIPMVAADTVYLTSQINGASGKNAIFRGLSGSVYINFWSGFLVC